MSAFCPSREIFWFPVSQNFLIFGCADVGMLLGMMQSSDLGFPGRSSASTDNHAQGNLLHQDFCW